MTSENQSAGGESHRTGAPLPNLSGRLTDGRPAAPALTDEAAAELAEIKKLRQSDLTKYYSKDVQARELELIAGQGGATAKAEGEPKTEAPAEKPADAAPATKDDLADMSAEEIGDELAQIAKTRRADRKRYDRELVDRELALLEAQQRGEVAGLPADVVAEWRETGGVSHNRQRAQGVVQAMLNGMNEAGDEAAGTEFMASFDALAEGARSAIYKGLALEPGGSARQASAAALEEFAGIGDETAALVQRWGKSAAQRLGAAQGRFGLMQAMMSPADREAALAWLDSLTPAQQAAVTAALAGA